MIWWNMMKLNWYGMQWIHKVVQVFAEAKLVQYKTANCCWVYGRYIELVMWSPTCVCKGQVGDSKQQPNAMWLMAIPPLFGDYDRPMLLMFWLCHSHSRMASYGTTMFFSGMSDLETLTWRYNATSATSARNFSSWNPKQTIPSFAW